MFEKANYIVLIIVAPKRNIKLVDIKDKYLYMNDIMRQSKENDLNIHFRYYFASASIQSGTISVSKWLSQAGKFGNIL